MSASSKIDYISENYAGKVYRNEGNSSLLRLISSDAVTVLDVGCGAGDNAKQLKTRGCKVTGLTVSQAEADVAASCCDTVVVVDVEGDLNFLGEQKYDVILLSHILEHLIRPAQLLEKLSKFLSPKGRIFVAVPNMAFWRQRVKLLSGDWTRTETGPMDRTHLHFWSFFTAKQLAAEASLELEAHIPTDFACPLWPLRATSRNFSKKIDLKLGPRFPNLFATQTILIIKQK